MQDTSGAENQKKLRETQKLVSDGAKINSFFKNVVTPNAS
jgi:hypothetical protein